MRISMLRSVSLLALASCALSAHAVVIDFESTANGTATAFSSTVDGLTASFSAATPGGVPSDGFSVQNSFFSTLTGHVLASGSGSDLTLTIGFSQALDGVSLTFATQASGPLSLIAYLGGTQVGTASATGAIPSGRSFPEGTLSFSRIAFDRVVLKTTQDAFAIDNVDASPIATAVPGPVAALPFALLALKRRKRA